MNSKEDSEQKGNHHCTATEDEEDISQFQTEEDSEYDNWQAIQMEQMEENAYNL